VAGNASVNPPSRTLGKLLRNLTMLLFDAGRKRLNCNSASHEDSSKSGMQIFALAFPVESQQAFSRFSANFDRRRIHFVIASSIRASQWGYPLSVRADRLTCGPVVAALSAVRIGQKACSRFHELLAVDHEAPGVLGGHFHPPPGPFLTGR
jgi:hypothetical protein